MVEKSVAYTLTDEKTIEKLIDEKDIAVNHMVLPMGTGLPEHFANAPVYMIVVRGHITLRLNGQDPHVYAAGRIVLIPNHTKMNVVNENADPAELFVIKAPGPRSFC